MAFGVVAVSLVGFGGLDGMAYVASLVGRMRGFWMGRRGEGGG